MNLTIKEAKKLVAELKQVINAVECICITCPTNNEKTQYIKSILEKQTEGIEKLYCELSGYISKVEHTTVIEFNFEDYL
jgi:hypothetical protein